MKRTSAPRILAFVLLAPWAGRAQDAARYESPPTLSASEMAPAEVPLKGDRYRVDAEVPTDGYLAEFTLRSDFGTVKARGPGMLRVRVNEVDALARLEKMETSDVFVEALSRSAASVGKSLANVVTNTAEVAKSVPASVGRFFERAGRQAKTAAQKLGDVKENREAGAPRGAAPATNQQNLAVAGGVAAGLAVRDVLGYDEERRHLARELGVDPYTTNPLLKKRLDDVAWAAFAGGLGVNVLTAKVPGGRLVQSTSVLSDWVYEKPPGDLKVWIEKSLRTLGVDQETIDLFLRVKSFTLTTQTALVMALESMSGVDGRAAVLDTAVTLETEEQARFLAMSLHMLAQEHTSQPLREILDGRPIGRTRDGRVVVCAAIDYLSWTERTAVFAAREDLVAAKPVLKLCGTLSATARRELASLGWTIDDHASCSGGF